MSSVVDNKTEIKFNTFSRVSTYKYWKQACIYHMCCSSCGGNKDGCFLRYDNV